MRYKEYRVVQHARLTAEAASLGGFVDGFVGNLAASMREEAHLHRLWFDLRAQALFEPAFRTDVAAIEKNLEDTVFQQSLLKHISGDPEAIELFEINLRALLERIVSPSCRAARSGA